MKTGKIKSRTGQTIIFLLVVLVILTLAVLWQFDVHRILFVKSRTQNAGDAAALAAARWQGTTLNLIGDMNIMKAIALSETNMEAVASISNLQSRLCYVGPMIAFMGAQQAAKHNGIYPNDSYTDRLRDHAHDVRHEYTEIGPDGQMLFPEPYPGCWEDYAEMLEYIADEGVAAGPDNARFYSDYSGSHTLLDVGFYEAIAGRSWCWFYSNAPDLLEEYRNFFPCWWEDLPPIAHRRYVNSEIFGLGLSRYSTSLSGFFEDEQAAIDAMLEHADQRGLGYPVNSNAFQSAMWYCYDRAQWSSWSDRDSMPTSDNPRPPNHFPSVGTVKEQYNYTGADSAVRIQAATERLTPGSARSETTNQITWTAAAKPFGYLSDTLRPDSYEIVLPAFREVRLIALDASSTPYGGSYNLAWRDHIEKHLPGHKDPGTGRWVRGYIDGGPNAEATSGSCWYCRQLRIWEDNQFRQDGVDWLEENSHLCTISPDGSGRGGGRRRGH
ncbi:MAG: pilus assembly protein TadG-related protein [Verrucomicrobiota bacterium]